MSEIVGWVRKSVPVSLTLIDSRNVKLFYLEAVNDDGQPITISMYDSENLCVVPPQIVNVGGILQYECKYGAPCNGLAWKASQPGLIAWFKGEI